MQKACSYQLRSSTQTEIKNISKSDPPYENTLRMSHMTSSGDRRL